VFYPAVRLKEQIGNVFSGKSRSAFVVARFAVCYFPLFPRRYQCYLFSVASEADVALMSLFAPGGADDPYPAYRKLRELDPVHSSDLLGMTVLSRFAECQEVLADAARFIVVDEAWKDTNTPGWRESPGATFLSALLPWRNPPEHTRERRLVARDFTVRRVEELRPSVQATVDKVLDRFADEGAGGEPVDFVDVVLYPLGMAVIGELVGVPAHDHEMFRGLVESIGRFVDPQVPEEVRHGADAAAVRYREYFVDLIARRRAEPRDDLTSALVADPDRMSDEDVLNSLTILFGGGFETTAGALGNGLYALLTHPEQYELLVGDLSLAANATEEILRWDSSAQVNQRIAVEPVELGGVAIPANTMLLSLLGAANRDPGRYPDPERFDITRAGRRGLFFGHGIHLCLGAALARLEMTALLAAVAARFPQLRLAGPVTRRPNMLLRGLATLPLTPG
jgi:cytochrome P450